MGEVLATVTVIAAGYLAGTAAARVHNWLDERKSRARLRAWEEQAARHRAEWAAMQRRWAAEAACGCSSAHTISRMGVARWAWDADGREVE